MYNKNLLMCRPDYFNISYSINPYMSTSQQPEHDKLRTEFNLIIQAHIDAGRTINFMEPIDGLPDMTYTANQALIRGNKALLGNLPPQRRDEIIHTKKWLINAGYEVMECPLAFSGQGDCLPTGTGAVIKGRKWRSDPRSDEIVKSFLGYEIIPVQTVSDRWYDNDLVFGIINPGLVAVCWEALDDQSVANLKKRDDLDFIDVDINEAKQFVLNLVSDGHTVTMSDGGPILKAALETRGFEVITRSIEQLKLGGGGIRCTTLALDAS